MLEKCFISVDRREPDSRGVCGISPDAFERFASLVPDLVNKGCVSTKQILSSDPIVKRILDALKAAGVDINNSAGVIPRPFILSRVREYEPADLAEVKYLVASFPKFTGETTDDNAHDERGIPHLKGALRPYDRPLGRVLGTNACPVLVVRGKVKNALEKSGLKGLQLAEPIIKGRKQLKPEERVWVLWSELTLPPMKNLCFDNAGERFRFQERTSFPQGCIVFEGYFGGSGELHYRRDALEQFGNFDIALTPERFGVRWARQPFVVVSQRFRQFLKNEVGEEITGVPVRVDEDEIIPWAGPYPPPWEHLNERPEWLKALSST